MFFSTLGILYCIAFECFRRYRTYIFFTGFYGIFLYNFKVTHVTHLLLRCYLVVTLRI